MAAYAGRKGVVYLAPDGSGAASAVLKVSKWSLDRQTDKIEVTAFQDLNKTYVQGLPDMKGTFEAYYDDTETKIFAAAASSAAVRMYTYISSDAASKYAYGLAWLDASIEVDVNGAVKVSGSFVAGGSWGINF
ncbi:MAG: hypothetical protein IT306_29225 [Chloroflexi bacterium]|nr:hypothetical protein [Chloroflexota bacterium]